jgi:hypothetical protein
VPVSSLVFIVILVIAVFAVDIGRRWWQENAWRRHWRHKPDDD